MTILIFERGWSFDASGFPAGDWVRGVLNAPAKYTVVSNTAQRLELTATDASPLPGYKLVLTPVSFFTPLVGTDAPVSGAVREVQLFDPSGVLVATLTDLPPDVDFRALVTSDALNLYGADIIGSPDADTLTGYATGIDLIDGGGGDDVLHGGSGVGDDLFAGGSGADTMSGGAGDDLFLAGDGADRIDGGDGLDLAILSEAIDRVEVWLNQAAAPGGVRIDNVELVGLGDAGGRVHGGAGPDGVIGGAGVDEIDGGAGDDLLAGLEGDDLIRAGAGDDLMDGGEGGDLLDGGDGFDMVDYSIASGGLTISLSLAGAQQTGLGLDTLVSIEGLYGSEFTDTLNGDAQANRFEALNGADLLDGGDGADTLDGGAGADRAFGGAGADSLTDVSGANFLRGNAGDDVIQGGAEFDDAHGNEGDDIVRGGGGDDWVVGGKDDDQLFGETGLDVVLGNLGNDTCLGEFGNDTVRGGQGDDIVVGGDGADWLAGDRGTDTLTGGAGSDIFHGWQETGADRITDFNAAEGDRVNLLPGSVYSVAQAGADTVIDFGGGHQLTLVNVQLSSLPAGWIFGA